jgi:hypothetical protein
MLVSLVGECLRCFGGPDKGFAEHRFHKKRGQVLQNAPEQRRENGAKRNDPGKPEPEPPNGLLNAA